MSRLITFTIVGIAPLLMDQMPPETLAGLITGVRKPIPKDTPLDKMAAAKIYRDPVTGRIGLPAGHLFASLKNAGRMIPYKAKKMISTADSTLLPSFFSVHSPFLLFNNIDRENEAASWEVDVKRGVGSTDVAVGIVRPRFDNWQFTVQVQLDEKLVSEDTLKNLVLNAGSCQGLGSFRPNCGGNYGRFTIKEGSWMSEEVIDIEPLKFAEQAKAAAEKYEEQFAKAA